MMCSGRQESGCKAGGSITVGAVIDDVNGLGQTWKRLDPLLRGGVDAPYKQTSRYFRTGRSGGGQKPLAQKAFDLPGSAESKVA